MTTTQVSKNETIFLKSDFTQKTKTPEVKTNAFEEIMEKAEDSDTSLISNQSQTTNNSDRISNASKTSFTKSNSTAAKDKIDQAKDSNSEDAVKLTEDQISEVNSKIKEFIMDKLDVSEEELENMMESMGIGYSDLLNPTKFSDLAAKLTSDSDVCSLLTSESFQNVFTDFSSLTNQLENDLGISLEELQKQLQIPENLLEGTDEEVNSLNPDTVGSNVLVADEVADNTNATQTTKDPVVKSDDAIIEVTHTEEPEVALEAAEEVFISANGKTTKEVVQTTEEVLQDEKGSVVESSVALEENEANQTSEDSLFEENTSEDKTSNGEKNVVETVRTSNGSIQTTTFANSVTNEVVQKYTSVDVENIIKQISDGIKVNISPDSTSMEIQLTPENLGKINLQVVAKNGAISAQILTQTEAAKAVVESQVSQLKESLNTQGLKVEAVEVSVASHGFERNLENSSQNQNFQNNSQNQSTQIRRSAIGSEISYTDDVTESAEELSAKMMLEQGNSVNLTA